MVFTEYLVSRSLSKSVTPLSTPVLFLKTGVPRLRIFVPRPPPLRDYFCYSFNISHDSPLPLFNTTPITPVPGPTVKFIPQSLQRDSSIENSMSELPLLPHSTHLSISCRVRFRDSDLTRMGRRSSLTPRLLLTH